MVLSATSLHPERTRGSSAGGDERMSVLSPHLSATVLLPSSSGLVSHEMDRGGSGWCSTHGKAEWSRRATEFKSLLSDAVVDAVRRWSGLARMFEVGMHGVRESQCGGTGCRNQS